MRRPTEQRTHLSNKKSALSSEILEGPGDRTKKYKADQCMERLPGRGEESHGQQTISTSQRCRDRENTLRCTCTCRNKDAVHGPTRPTDFASSDTRQEDQNLEKGDPGTWPDSRSLLVKLETKSLQSHGATNLICIHVNLCIHGLSFQLLCTNRKAASLTACPSEEDTRDTV